MKILLMIAASTVSASLLVPTLAEARTSDDLVQDSRIVRYDDLNLQSARGQAILDRRITAAARKVCGAHGEDNINLSRVLAVNACIREAKDQANREVRAATQRPSLQVRPA